MKRFAIHLLSFVLFITALLSIITLATDAGLHKSNYSWYHDWNGVRNGTINAGVLIMGSSHAHLGVDPAVADTALHTNCYNLGIDGYMFDVQLARYNMYRKYNSAPKLIIQCMDYYELGRADRLIDEAQFLPYLADKGLDTALVKMGLPWHYGYFPFLKYQNYPGLAARGIGRLLAHSNESSKNYKGFYGQPETWDTTAFERFLKDTKYLGPEINTDVLQQFTTFLDTCRRQNIRVVLVFTPHYYQFTNAMFYHKQYIAFLRSIAAAHHVEFCDFTTDTMCYDRRYFSNGTHLNKVGATLFSQKICAHLKASR